MMERTKMFSVIKQLLNSHQLLPPSEYAGIIVKCTRTESLDVTVN
jgi:hypothetical protein